MAEVKRGQVWREVDPRRERFVHVISNGDTPKVAIQTVERDGAGWKLVAGTRVNHVDPSRFNGRRGGYILVDAREM